MKTKASISRAPALGLPVLGGCSKGSINSQEFTPPVDSGLGRILFVASVEVLALTGRAFPPENPDDLAFVDSWQVNLARLLVTIDKIMFWSNTDVSPGNQALTDPTPGTVGSGLVVVTTGCLRDYYDFATYDQGTQGHLNSDDLCAVERHYPSPQ
jgi:hypothetical protein